MACKKMMFFVTKSFFLQYKRKIKQNGKENKNSVRFGKSENS